jgi:hypothetical protein
LLVHRPFHTCAFWCRPIPSVSSHGTKTHT